MYADTDVLQCLRWFEWIDEKKAEIMESAPISRCNLAVISRFSLSE
jgi:hypothetical protein